MTEIRMLGRNKTLQIGGFIAIGRTPGAPVAYVAEEPDARLFCTAPDLLESLKWALKMVNVSQLTPAGLSDYRNAVDAINKAESRAESTRKAGTLEAVR